MQMQLVARTDAFLQRFGWILPLFGFFSGWASFVLIRRGDNLARLIAISVLVGWVWLFFQPFIRRGVRKLGGERLGNATVNFVAQSIQQEILFFSLPFLVLATKVADPGQVLVTGIVIIAALISTIDPLYEKYIAKRKLLCLGFHSLCSFIAALIVLPIVVKIPLEKSFNIALGFVLLWLVVAAPLNLRQNTISLRVFALALMFPLLVWGFKSHIPAAGIKVERAVLTSAVQDHEPLDELTVVSLAQLEKGLYVHASISAPLGLSQEVIFDWRHEDYSESIPAVIIGGRKQGFRTYAFKENFMNSPEGRWAVDILTPQGQLLERVEFTVAGGEPLQ